MPHEHDWNKNIQIEVSGVLIFVLSLVIAIGNWYYCKTKNGQEKKQVARTQEVHDRAPQDDNTKAEEESKDDEQETFVRNGEKSSCLSRTFRTVDETT